MARFLLAFICGGALSTAIMNHIWYPLPEWIQHLHGVRLGLLAGAVFISGSFVTCAVSWAAARTWVSAGESGRVCHSNAGTHVTPTPTERGRMREMASTHALVRTNEKGVPGIFRCINCGKTDFPANAALWECENVLGRTQDESLIAVICGPDH